MLHAQNHTKNARVNYSPFGAILYGRNWSSEKYRYGFNGMEKDDEVKGSGNSYDYVNRFYDPRLGRFLSIDGLASSFPWYTPYQFAGNTPIIAIDIDGLEEFVVVHFTQNEETRQTLIVHLHDNDRVKSEFNGVVYIKLDVTEIDGTNGKNYLTVDSNGDLSFDFITFYKDFLKKPEQPSWTTKEREEFIKNNKLPEKKEQVSDNNTPTKEQMKNAFESGEGVYNDFIGVERIWIRQGGFDNYDVQISKKSMGLTWQFFQSKGAQKFVTYPEPSDITFETNKDILTSSGKKELDKLFVLMVLEPKSNYHLVGHTDSDGSIIKNQKLSEERAEAAKTYLVSKGISGNRLTTEGKGSTQAKGTNNEAKAKDRKVEMIKK